MDEADVAEGSREELQRGLYLVDEKIICGTWYYTPYNVESKLK